MSTYLPWTRGSEMASASSRKALLRPKHSAISPVISVDCSGTRSKNLWKPDAMSCAVSADAKRDMASW